MSEITDPAAGIVAEAAPLVKKTCTKCGAEKVLEEFTPSRGGRFGRHSRCKACARLYNRAYFNRPGIREKQRQYDKLRLQDYFKRPETKARRREYVNKPEVKEKIREARKRPEFKKWAREYMRRMRRTNLAFKIASNLRARVKAAIQGRAKAAHTLDLLGCTVEELRAHLEAQFKPDMTWENYGRYGWHIDHIRPCASFDLTDPDQQRTCFHYSNLQPLWATENHSKGAKLLDTFPTA